MTKMEEKGMEMKGLRMNTGKIKMSGEQDSGGGLGTISL